MSDDELLALYGTVRELAAAMKAREAVLDQRLAALNTAIAELGKMPEALGKQTGQYIAAGVKASIQDDFKGPIKTAVDGPIAELNIAAHHAQSVLREAQGEARYHTWTWLGVIFGLGLLIGALGYHFMAMRAIDEVREGVQVIQQQTAPAQPAAVDVQPAAKRKGRGH